MQQEEVLIFDVTKHDAKLTFHENATANVQTLINLAHVNQADCVCRSPKNPANKSCQ